MNGKNPKSKTLFSSFDVIREKSMLPIYQIVGGLTAVSLIIIGCIIVITPFIPAIIFSTILALSTWPAFNWVKNHLQGRMALSALIMTVLLAICFIIPLVIIGSSTSENFAKLFTAVQVSLNGNGAEQAQFLKTLPVLGDFVSEQWVELTADKARMNRFMETYGARFSEKLIGIGASVGRGLLDLTLGVLIAYFFFRHGSRVAERTTNLIETFGGLRGQHLLEVCKNTLIGVVYGILGTSLAQGALAALGFWMADMPGASFLGLLTFFLSFIPGGTPVIWLPASVWLYQQGQSSAGAFVFIWGLFVVSMIDNVLRPYFISRESNLPFLLVLLGVIGGIIAFGFIGVFIGPTLLALAYSLILGWSGPQPAEDPALPPEDENDD